MPTLAVMKARIAREVHRDDLTDAIAEAIGDAVDDYKPIRFAFNQTRDTFSTVAGQEFYTTSSIPADIAEVDALTITVNGRKVELSPWPFSVMERINTTTNSRGQPTAWSWYAQQVRLYPVPDAVYSITVSYLQRIDIPDSDAGANVWTTEAEALIRSSAKKRLFTVNIADPQGAAASAAMEEQAFRRLMRESRQLDTGGLVPNC